MSNTSLTVRDVLDLTVLEFQELLEGMDAYSKEVEKELKGTTSKEETLEGKEGIEYLLNTFK